MGTPTLGDCLASALGQAGPQLDASPCLPAVLLSPHADVLQPQARPWPPTFLDTASLETPRRWHACSSLPAWHVLFCLLPLLLNVLFCHLAILGPYSWWVEHSRAPSCVWSILCAMNTVPLGPGNTWLSPGGTTLRDHLCCDSRILECVCLQCACAHVGKAQPNWMCWQVVQMQTI